MKKILKNNYKIIIGLILGIVISTTSVYALNISSSSVEYDNSSSNLTSNNVKDAIDEVYQVHSYGDASENDVLSGKTFVSNGKKKVGNILINASGFGGEAVESGTAVNYSSTNVSLSGSNILLENGSKLTIPSGYYSNPISISNIKDNASLNQFQVFFMCYGNYPYILGGTNYDGTVTAVSNAAANVNLDSSGHKISLSSYYSSGFHVLATADVAGTWNGVHYDANQTMHIVNGHSVGTVFKYTFIPD